MCHTSSYCRCSAEALLSLLKGTYETKCCAEAGQRKAKFIQRVVHAGKDSCCIFRDVADISKQTAPCWVHGSDDKAKRCRVLAASVSLGEWSCKGLSKANPKWASNRHAIREGSTTSGTTFAALISFLQSKPNLVWYIGENVDEICNLSSDNREAMFEASWQRVQYNATRCMSCGLTNLVLCIQSSV